MTIADRITAEILAERQRQDEKWGPQSHPLTFEGSFRTPEYWATEAKEWQQTNDHRVGVRTAQGYGKEENCAWDGILEEEIAEAFGSERAGLQYAEFVQAAAVTRKILELLNERAFKQTGHFASCPALDVDWILTAPEACDCEPEPRFVPKQLDTVFDTWGIWDNKAEAWYEGDFGNAEGDARSRARAMNDNWAMEQQK